MMTSLVITAIPYEDGMTVLYDQDTTSVMIVPAGNQLMIVLAQSKPAENPLVGGRNTANTFTGIFDEEDEDDED